MVHHVPNARPRSARESVQNSIAREVMIWLIAADPDDHAFPNQLAPGDMALSEMGNVWLYNGLRWNLLVHSSAPDDGQTEVRNMRVLTDKNRIEVERNRDV